jgi:hypothetical protein
LKVALHWQTAPGVLIEFRPFKAVFQQLASLINGSVSVITGLNCQLVLRNRPFSLASYVEDFPDLDVTPNFGPNGISVSARRVSEGVDTGLIFALLEKQLSHAITGQRAVRGRFQLILVFRDRLLLVATRGRSAYRDLRRRHCRCGRNYNQKTADANGCWHNTSSGSGFHANQICWRKRSRIRVIDGCTTERVASRFCRGLRITG